MSDDSWPAAFTIQPSIVNANGHVTRGAACRSNIHNSRLNYADVFRRILFSKYTNVLRSGTAVRCCISAQQTLPVQSPGGSTFLRAWRHGRHLETVTSNRKSVSDNRCAFMWRTLRPISSRSDLKRWSLRLFGSKRGRINKYKISSDLISVPDLKCSL